MTNEDVLVSLHVLHNKVHIAKRHITQENDNDDDEVRKMFRCAELTQAAMQRNNLSCYVKRYIGEDNGIEQINYEENEWRYIPKNYKLTNAFVGENAIDESKEPLKFTVEDITWIIVETNTHIPKMVETIKKLKTLGGEKDIKLTSNDKAILCSKIISLDTIEKDI